MKYEVKMYLRKLSKRNKLFSSIYNRASRVRELSARNLNDEVFARQHYKENTGRNLDLQNPVTFDEKLWWLKLYNRDPLLTKCSDKYLVREYVTECGLGHILNELYGVYKNADEIDYGNLPDRFILKCNHGSDANIICNDKAHFSRSQAARKLNAALQRNFYYESREWNYKDIEPRIICERLLEDPGSGVGLIDYRFLCFNGVAEAVLVTVGACMEDGSHSKTTRRNLYDRDYKLLDVNFVHAQEHFPIGLAPKPANYEEMRSCAERLAEPFPHVRVDLYNINGQIYFGEMTFYHGGCRNNIQPEEWAVKLGNWIDLSLVKDSR